MKDTKTYNIARSVAAICRKLGHEPEMVRWMKISPTAVRLVIYKQNENGAKYLEKDGRVATKTFSYKVKT